MRIASTTLRRNYLNNYERANTSRFESENKISSNRQYVRASQEPVKAARAMRVRKALSEIDTYQTNLNSAHSIYTLAESSMSTISEQIQLVYEKLVEGAHGTRNPDDLKIIAMDVEKKAEQMVELLNVVSANRKIFGGTNNETVAFEIKGDEATGKYVTYNGVPVNASADPLSYPYSGVSFLDIGIGMTMGENSDRIDDQTALPITLNGVQCTGCGVTGRSVKLDLETIGPGRYYKLKVSVGALTKNVEFNGGDTIRQTIENINEAFKEQFQLTPQVDENGDILYLENREGLDEKEGLYNYENAQINNGQVNLSAMDSDSYYSLTISSNGKTRVIDFQGDDDVNITLDNIRKELEKKFGKDAPTVYSNGIFSDENGNRVEVANTSDYSNNVAMSGDNISLTALEEGKEYSINLNGVKVTFTGGANPLKSMENINKAMNSGLAFGKSNVPYIVNDTGIIMYDKTEDIIYVENTDDSDNDIDFTESGGYPKNIMQIVLDSAKLLRENDQNMVARYADLLYAAQSNLSIAIADLGTNDQFVEFNIARTENIKINLDEQQNDLEFTDLPSEITNLKLLQSIYNATLQMGAQVVPMSIFNYIS